MGLFFVFEFLIVKETNIFDFTGSLYGSDVKISFAEFIRPEKKFTSVEELSHQIETDEKNARKSLAVHANLVTYAER